MTEPLCTVTHWRGAAATANWEPDVIATMRSSRFAHSRGPEPTSAFTFRAHESVLPRVPNDRGSFSPRLPSCSPATISRSCVLVVQRAGLRWAPGASWLGSRLKGLVRPASRLAGREAVERLLVTRMTGERHVSGSPGSDSVGKSGSEDRPAPDLVAEDATRVVWDDRWHEEEIFANRLSFYLLAQSFLVLAAVEATLSSVAASRWFPLALIIDLAGLILTLVFWYALTENLRRLDALKEIVAKGSPEVGVHGYREIGAIRTAHHQRRSQRGLPFPLSILPRWSPSWWLAHGIPALLGSMWLALIATAIVTAA
jgi:hypothetical protein